MINLGEYMLNVKNKVMNTLKEEIECSKGHLLYLIDVHIFSKEDINLNTTTLAWPQKIKPVFEQNTELVEDCKVGCSSPEHRAGRGLYCKVGCRSPKHRAG